MVSVHFDSWYQFFKYFVDLCRKNNIDLILLQIPVLERRKIKDLDFYTEKYAVPYYNFSFKNDEDYYDYKYEDFELVNYLWPISSETVKRFLPFALLLDITFCPSFEDIRSMKPCLFLRFLFDGWNVLFGMTFFLCYFWDANLIFFLIQTRFE